MLMPKTGGRLFFSCYHTQAGVRGNCAQNSVEDFNNTFNLNNNGKFWHLTSLSTRVRHLHVKQFCFSLLGWFIHVAALCLAHLCFFFFPFKIVWEHFNDLCFTRKQFPAQWMLSIEKRWDFLCLLGSCLLRLLFVARWPHAAASKWQNSCFFCFWAWPLEPYLWVSSW